MTPAGRTDDGGLPTANRQRTSVHPTTTARVVGKVTYTCADSMCSGHPHIAADGEGAELADERVRVFHRSHTPLSTWFAAVWFVTSQKNGMSAMGLQQALGFGSYETAWAWLHKMRRAMVRPDRELLTGTVELDQSFLGGRSTGKTGASSDKVPVTIAVERDDLGRLGRVRLEMADAPGKLDIVEFGCEVVQPGSTVRTDGARMFQRFAERGYIHEATKSYTVEDRDTVMPGPHLVSSLLKRWTAGTLHYRLSPQHLPYYLDEFTFRFNRRKSRARGMLFYRLLQQAVDTDPHPLKELIGG